MRLFLAPFKTDARVRKRIEGAILQSLYDGQDTFMLEGIRYQLRRHGEEPIECTVAAPVPLLGMPKHFQA